MIKPACGLSYAKITPDRRHVHQTKTPQVDYSFIITNTQQNRGVNIHSVLYPLDDFRGMVYGIEDITTYKGRVINGVTPIMEVYPFTSKSCSSSFVQFVVESTDEYKLIGSCDRIRDLDLVLFDEVQIPYTRGGILLTLDALFVGKLNVYEMPTKETTKELYLFYVSEGDYRFIYDTALIRKTNYNREVDLPDDILIEYSDNLLIREGAEIITHLYKTSSSGRDSLYEMKEFIESPLFEHIDDQNRFRVSGAFVDGDGSFYMAKQSFQDDVMERRIYIGKRRNEKWKVENIKYLEFEYYQVLFEGRSHYLLP